MSKPLKILQVCRLTPLWGMDLFREISRAFANPPASQVTTVFLSGEKPSSPLAETYNGQVHCFNINRKLPFWRLLAFFKLYGLCRREQFDAVFCHHYKPTLITEWVSRCCPIKKRFSIHHDAGNFEQKSRKWFSRTFLAKRWQFIAVSQGVKQNLIDANAGIKAQQVHVVHNVIDIPLLEKQQFDRATARHRINIPAEDFVFGTIGRLVERKGHALLMQAFADLKLPKTCRLVIIGQGPLAEPLQTLAESLTIAEQVTIVGGDIAKHAAHYARAFDVFVLPSLAEGFGLVLLEAMAARLPIIGTTVGGIPEVLGNHGTLIPSHDREALHHALQKHYQLNQNERTKLGDDNYRHLLSNFSTERYHRDFQRLILEV